MIEKEVEELVDCMGKNVAEKVIEKNGYKSGQKRVNKGEYTILRVVALNICITKCGDNRPIFDLKTSCSDHPIQAASN